MPNKANKRDSVKKTMFKETYNGAKKGGKKVVDTVRTGAKKAYKWFGKMTGLSKSSQPGQQVWGLFPFCWRLSWRIFFLFLQNLRLFLPEKFNIATKWWWYTWWYRCENGRYFINNNIIIYPVIINTFIIRILLFTVRGANCEILFCRQSDFSENFAKY